MRSLRLPLVGIALLTCLVIGVPTALAQETPCDPDGVCVEELFEVALPPGVMADHIARISSGGLTFAPGVEAVIGIDNEAMRGRFLYVETGQLLVVPMVDSPVWLDGAALGGPAATARAGEEVELAVGDLIFIPVIAGGDLVPDATIAIANPGPEPTVTRGFHAHAYEGFDGWPDGISENEGAVAASDAEDLDAVVAGNMTYRMTRTTAPVGASLPLDDDALFTLTDVYEGRVQRTANEGEGAPPFWNPIHGGNLTARSGWDYGLMVTGKTPAVVSQIAVLPTPSEA